MEKDPNLSSVNKMILQVIAAPAGGTPLSQEEKEKIIKEADRLPYHWLRSVSKKVTKASLNCLVQLAQKTTIWMLNQHYKNRVAGFAAGESDYDGPDYLERSLTRFLRYLERNFQNHFDLNSPMPRNLWRPIKVLIHETIIMHESSCLKEVDETLVALLNEACSSMIGKHPPSFTKAYYWEMLAGVLKNTLPVNDPTLQTIYTLISCNFNSDAFAKYVINYYGKELEPGEDATGFWKAHLVELGWIHLRHDMVLNPELSFSCIEMVIACINNELQRFVYSGNANWLNSAPVRFETPLSGASLALYYRVKIEAGMQHTDNKKELMRQVAQLYQTPGGSLSHKRLYDKYYNFDLATIENVKFYLAEMMKLLQKYTKNPPGGG